MAINLTPKNENSLIQTTDESIDNRFESLKKFDLNLFPLTCKKEYLPHLAFMFDVDIVGLSEKTQRELLNRAITLKKYIGSVHYLKEILLALDKKLKVLEWFEYGGEPYHFKVELTLTDVKARIDNAFMDELQTKIEFYKNVRSTCEQILIKLQEAQVPVFVQSVSTLEPHLSNEVNVDGQSKADIFVLNGAVSTVKLNNEIKVNASLNCNLFINKGVVWTI